MVRPDTVGETSVMRLSRSLVVAAIATVSLSAAVALADARRSHQQSVPDETALRMTGGVLRKTGGDWRVYDPSHAHLGIGALTCTSDGILHVAFDPVGLETGFGAVVPDETLAHLAVTVGVNATRSELRLSFFRGLDNRGRARKLSCASSVFDTPLSNLWMTWSQDVDPVPEESEDPDD